MTQVDFLVTLLEDYVVDLAFIWPHFDSRDRLTNVNKGAVELLFLIIFFVFFTHDISLWNHITDLKFELELMQLVVRPGAVDLT